MPVSTCGVSYVRPTPQLPPLVAAKGCKEPELPATSQDQLLVRQQHWQPHCSSCARATNLPATPSCSPQTGIRATSPACHFAAASKPPGLVEPSQLSFSRVRDASIAKPPNTHPENANPSVHTGNTNAKQGCESPCLSLSAPSDARKMQLVKSQMRGRVHTLLGTGLTTGTSSK